MLGRDPAHEVLVLEVPLVFLVVVPPQPLERPFVREEVQVPYPLPELILVNRPAVIPVQLPEYLPSAPVRVARLDDLIDQQLLQLVTVEHMRRGHDIRRLRVVVRDRLPVPIFVPPVVVVREHGTDELVKLNRPVAVVVVIVQDLGQRLPRGVDVHALDTLGELLAVDRPGVVVVELLEELTKRHETLAPGRHPIRELALELLHAQPLLALVLRVRARRAEAQARRILRRDAVGGRSPRRGVDVEGLEHIGGGVVQALRGRQRGEELHILELALAALVVL